MNLTNPTRCVSGVCRNTLIFIFISLASPWALALTATGEEPIHIVADRAQLDDTKGMAVYSGEVRIEQGDSSLEADEVTIYASKEGLIRIEAKGTPAHFKQRTDENKPATHAYGDQIIYTHDDETITIMKNARLQQEKNSFQGNMIKYNTRTRIVTATGTGDKSRPGGQVELIFHPKGSDASRSEKATRQNNREGE